MMISEKKKKKIIYAVFLFVIVLCTINWKYIENMYMVSYYKRSNYHWMISIFKSFDSMVRSIPLYLLEDIVLIVICLLVLIILILLIGIIELKKANENKKRLQEALEYDKLKTQFFANISHEFRTPLNVIYSILQLIDTYKEKGLTIDSEKREYYDSKIKQNGMRLLRLVNNLIDVTKIDTNYFKLNLKNCNIINLVEDITLSVAEYMESKNLKVLFDTDTEEKIIACDPDQIERIILNLLSNAVKFSKPGGMIMVNMYDKQDNVVISVKDNGIGIPKEKQEVIFERFRQVDKTFARCHEGSGIGLSLVKSLVDLHGGSIYVKSKEGLGSEFIVSIPADILNEPEIKNNCTNWGEYMEIVHVEFSDIYIEK